MSTLHVNLIGRFGEPPFESHRTAGLFKKSGIYAIINQVDGKRYIGSAACLKTRISYHKSKLRNDRHDNAYLQRAWNKYGEVNFRFFIIQFCKVSELLEKEAMWMWLTCACERRLGYNLDRITTRKFHSQETKEKMSLAAKGRKPMSSETRDKISLANKGRKHLTPKSPEMRKRYSLAMMGHPVSDEARKKMSAIHKRKVISTEHRAAISRYFKGRSQTEGHKAKRLASWKEGRTKINFGLFA